MGSLLKGLLSWIVGGVFWIAERLWGDAAYDWLKPMIPDFIENPTASGLITWGPPIALFCLGCYFLFKHFRQPIIKIGRNTKNGSKIVKMKNKSLLDQSINVGGDNPGTIAPVYNNRVQIGVEPELQVSKERRTEIHENGTMITTIYARMTSPASSLHVQAQGDNLISMDISRPIVNNVSSTTKLELKKWSNNECIDESFSSPSGKYVIYIRTNDSTPPELAWEVVP